MQGGAVIAKESDHNDFMPPVNISRKPLLEVLPANGQIRYHTPPSKRPPAAPCLLCFNAVDKPRINNNLYVSHTAQHDGSEFSFRSGWHYAGPGERQSLRLSIDRNTNGVCESWQDEHPMVALSFGEFEALLKPWFEVHIFEHDYERIVPWDGESGNAIFACVKR